MFPILVDFRDLPPVRSRTVVFKSKIDACISRGRAKGIEL